MPDLAAIQPIAAIIGALISAAIGAAVTYFLVVKRKRIRFAIVRSTDLTRPLRQHRTILVFKMDDSELLNLNRAGVVVRNTGNATITGLSFDIVVDGTHKFCRPEVVADDFKLMNSVALN